MFAKLVQPLGPFLRQYVIVIAVNLSLLSTGLGLAWTSPVLVKLSNENSTELGRPITVNEGSWFASATFISGFIANYTAAYLVDRIGRKYTIILSTLPRIACYLLLIFTSEVWLVLAARLLVGISDAVSFTTVPMYSSEIASKEIRGGLGTVLQIFSCLGMVTMLCMGPYLDYRTLNETVLYIVIATSAPLLFLPDSPYILYKKGKTNEAIKLLTFLRGTTELAHEELKEYQAMDTSSVPISLSEVLKSRLVLKALGIVTLLGMGMQLTGFNAVAYYLQAIIESTNISISSELASVVLGLIQFLASLCTVGIVDRFGRKPILVATLVGQSIGMLGLGSFFYVVGAGYEVVGFLNYLPLISISLVISSFSAGLGSIVWNLMAELFDGRFRAIGMNFGYMASVSSLFLVMLFFAPVTLLIGPTATYWIFGFFTVCMCVFILYCVPETRGKSFLEIQRAMDGKRKHANGAETIIKL